MYQIKSVAYGREFTTAVGQGGIVITEGFSPIVGRDLDEFLSHFAQAHNRTLQEVHTELADLIAEIKSIFGD